MAKVTLAKIKSKTAFIEKWLEPTPLCGGGGDFWRFFL
mgnify:CR=1 FL=1